MHEFGEMTDVCCSFCVSQSYCVSYKCRGSDIIVSKISSACRLVGGRGLIVVLSMCKQIMVSGE